MERIQSLLMNKCNYPIAMSGEDMPFFFFMKWIARLLFFLVCTSSFDTHAQSETSTDAGWNTRLRNACALEFIQVAEKTARWLKQNEGILSQSLLDSYNDRVTYLKAGLHMGGNGPIRFVEEMPRDSDGNMKSAVFKLEPNPEVHIHRRTWMNWRKKKNESIYNLRSMYLQVNLEVLGLAGVLEKDRYHLATTIADNALQIDFFDQNKTDNFLTKSKQGEAPLKGVSSGLGGPLVAGSRRLEYPISTIVNAPINRILQAFKRLENSASSLAALTHSIDFESIHSDYDVGFDSSRTGKEFVSLKYLTPNDSLLVTLDTSNLISSLNNSIKRMNQSLLVKVKSEGLQFRISRIDANSSQIEILSNDGFLVNINNFHESWAFLERHDLVYEFISNIKDSASLYLYLRIFHPQVKNEFIDFKIQLSQLNEDEPAWFEVSLSKGQLNRPEFSFYGKYGTEFPLGGPGLAR